MSLHNWNDLEIPDGMEFVTDNEFYFMNVTKDKLDNNVDRLLEYVDKAKFVDSQVFKDRFGRGLYWNMLSTGGKTILNVFYNPAVCFDCTEAGDNAHATINSMITNGNVKTCMPWVLGPEYIDIDIMKGNNINERYTNITDYCVSLDLGEYGVPEDMEEGEWY